MLKKALLSTVAMAFLAVTPQGAVTPALGAQMKIKPKVKVAPKPRIRVIKPRVRVRVNTKHLAPKKQGGEENSSAVTTRAPRATQQVPRVMALPLRKPQLGDESKVPGDKTSELSQIEGLKDAMEASEGMIEVATIGATFNLPDPLNPHEDEQANASDTANPSVDGSAVVPPGSSQLGDPLNGAGPDSDAFGFLENSHRTAPRNTPGSKTGDAAKNALGVTPGRIAAAIGGIASGDDDDAATLPVYTGKDTRTDEVHRDYWANERANGSTMFKFRADGSSTIVQDIYGDLGGDPDTDLHDRRVIEIDGEGQRTETEFDTSRVDELRDPDSAPGGNHPFHWLEGPRETILDVIAGIGPGGFQPGPGESQSVSWSLSAPVISQHTLISNYDPDSTRSGGAPTPIPTCLHSEC